MGSLRMLPSANVLMRKLSLAWKTAEMADRAKSSFLSAASHDLRQPLQTLKLLQAALEPHHPAARLANLSLQSGSRWTP